MPKATSLTVRAKLGSIERGKKANLVVADGDILELQTTVKHMFIAGRPVDLRTRFDDALAVYGSRK